MAASLVDAGTVEYPTGGESVAFTLPLPAGTQAGDVFLLSAAVDGRAGASIAAPANAQVLAAWSSPLAGSGDRITAGAWFWKVPETVPASVSFTWGAAQRGTLAWLQLRGAGDLALNVSASAGWSEAGPEVVLPSVNTTQPQCFVVGGVSYRTGSSRTPGMPTGWTLRADGAERKGAIATKGVQEAAGASGAGTVVLDSAGDSPGWFPALAWTAAIADVVSEPPPATVESVLSGAVTDHSATVKARITGGTGTPVLQVSTNTGLTGATAVTGQPVADDVWVFQPNGLAPDTVYHYGFDDTRAGQFRTFPPEGQPATFTIAGGSCNSTASASPVFGRILARNPLLFHHMGDWGYADIPTNNISLYRQAYKDNLGAPAQAALFANTAMSYTWDDHDFGPNNSVGSHVGKPSAQQAYREYVPHYPLPADTRPGGKGEIYQTYVIGRVRHIVLDCKSERDEEAAPDNANKSTLGADQKAWLKETLLAATEPLIILEVSEPWIASGGTMDGWGMYTTERAELSQFFEDHDLTRRLLIWHGDAHMLAADDGTNSNYAPAPSSPKGPPVFNFAPLDRTNSIKGGPYTEGTHTGSQTQYGTLDITDDGETITVLGRGWQVNGATESVVLTMVVTYSSDAPEPARTTALLTNPPGRWVKNTLRPIWRDGDTWRAILPTEAGHRVDTLTPDGGILTGPVIDPRQASRPTVVHASEGTFILMGHPAQSRLVVLDGALGEVRSSTVPLNAADHDASPIALCRTPNGYLWAAVHAGGIVQVARSVDAGASWQATQAVVTATAATGAVALAAAGETLVLVASENAGQGRHVRTIDQDFAAYTAGQWATEALPALPGVTVGDDHLTVAPLSGGRLIVAGKTESPTASQPLLYSAIRSSAGEWTMQAIEPGPDTGTRYTRPSLTVAGSLAVVHYGSIHAPMALTRRTLDLTADSPTWSAASTVASGSGQDWSDSAATPATVAGAPWPFVAHNRATGALQVMWSTEWAELPEHPMYVGTRRVIEVRVGRSLAGTFP